ncbi:solute carrier family 25 member 51-like [Pomacea canaliculata]|uniref:solute carrier family 25 member 51-like n=1 Tax=Pomacea canaliculata TaxID=400727 RepID=UPI000D72B92E|nr:solute carrier family 25 member 51-like [Pomacea canaliculata]XP_025089100.1 solute carrier family 25 member 51-like [Pomacea canaliculata]
MAEPVMDHSDYKNDSRAYDNMTNGQFLCGWGSACINLTITFPLHKTIFRQQLQGISGLHAVRQLRNEGLHNLYRGFMPPLIQKTTTLSIMFGSYHKFRVYFDSSYKSLPKQVTHATAAMIAGTLESVLTPFERIQMLLQHRMYQHHFQNTLHAGKELWSYGVMEYYRGLVPILLRNGPSNVCFFLGREFLNECMPQIADNPTRLVKDFFLGACLGAAISTLFFPLNVVKTHMQARLGGPFVGVWQSFLVVWRERNGSIRNLYRGYHLNYMRSFISWGIINASYEFLLQMYQNLHYRSSR